MGYSIVQLSFKLAEIFTNKKFTYKILMSLDKSDKSYKRVETFTTIILLLLIGLHVGGYIYFVKYQDKMLLERGIITKTIVINKKLENRERNGKLKNYIYYNYLYNGKTYKHNSENDFFEIGDTIIIKLLPENPDNHIIIENCPNTENKIVN
jgi:hypothetical protein